MAFIYDKFARKSYPLAAAYSGLPRFGLITNNSGAPQVARVSTAGAYYDGVIELNDDAQAAQEMGSVVKSHHQEVEAGAAVTVGQRVSSDNVGRGIPRTATQFSACVCVKGASNAGEIIEVDFTAVSDSVA